MSVYKTKAYRAWMAMKARCRYPKNRSYRYCGAKGVRVCERWMESFANFHADMGDPPTVRHSMDRIDTNGHYEPRNCRWATRRQQDWNKRGTMRVQVGDESLTVVDIQERTGLTRAAIRNRIRKGWSPDLIVGLPLLPLNARNMFRTYERKAR